MNCKDCVHYDACHRADREIPAESCRTFKNKLDFVESGRTIELISPIVIKLMKAFPQSVINYNCEFITDPNTNQWFRLEDCHSELDIKCKVLEWLSRAACKTQLSYSERKNRELQSEMRKHINEYLGTLFTIADMRTIYTYLGNACNHEKTIEFINSGYDMSILQEE